MSIFGQGIYFGLLLAILVGPLLVALVQASLEQGTKAGFVVGLGIWVSDFSYIVSVYFGIRYVNQLINWPGFELTLGLIGAVVLLGAGISTLLTPPPQLDDPNPALHEKKDTVALWSKGFFINTFNPFTVFFWVSVMTGVVLKNEYTHHQSFLFFAGLFGTVVFTDCLKILLAKVIRHRLTTRHLWWIRRVAGLALIVFAIALAIRVIF
jgi:threonine/homoserine/homoserine lactone efflux protein